MNKTQIINRSAFVRETSEEMKAKRQQEFVISSEAVDSFKTVFTRDGWDLKPYENNSIVCYQHRVGSENPDDVIGTSEVFFEGDKLIGRITFEDAETNPKAEKIMRKVHNGTLKMASINAKVSQYRYGIKANGEDPSVIYFTRQELMEWSIVTVGSNPDALKRNAEAIEIIRKDVTSDIEVIETEITENKSRTISAFEAQILINN